MLSTENFAKEAIKDIPNTESTLSGTLCPHGILYIYSTLIVICYTPENWFCPHGIATTNTHTQTHSCKVTDYFFIEKTLELKF